MHITLRAEKPKDYQGITRVNDMAFKRKAEGKLVEELRELKNFDKRLSIVAEVDDEIVGHVLFSPVSITAKKKDIDSLTLAPMSVLPAYQERGIGKLLIVFGLQMAKEAGYNSMFVLGHPSYYPKFGFKKASNWNIKSPFPSPDEAFMAIELVKGSLKGVSGRVIFPAAFDNV